MVLELESPAAAAEEVDEAAAVFELAAVAAAVVAAALIWDVTTTVSGASDDWPADGDCVTIEVMRIVDGATEEAETIEVTTFVDEAGTVVVVPPLFWLEERICEDTDCAMDEEMDACTDDDDAAFVVEEKDDEEKELLEVDVAGAVDMISWCR